jgi:hypothetical protein
VDQRILFDTSGRRQDIIGRSSALSKGFRWVFTGDPRPRPSSDTDSQERFDIGQKTVCILVVLYTSLYAMILVKPGFNPVYATGITLYLVGFCVFWFIVLYAAYFLIGTFHPESTDWYVLEWLTTLILTTVLVGSIVYILIPAAVTTYCPQGMRCL